MPNVVAIIQARMGSTRLPGKSLAEIAGRPMLWHVVNRVKRIPSVDRVEVATSVLPEDDAILDFCLRHGVSCVRGDASDVLDRYLKAATLAKADVIVRVTGDCPLLCPKTAGYVVQHFLGNSFDYVSNVFPKRTFPDGLDTEVFSLATLKRIWREAQEPADREHVTRYVHEHPEGFKIGSVENGSDLSSHKCSVDTAEELELVRRAYARISVVSESTDRFFKEAIKRPGIDSIMRKLGTR